VKLRIVMCPIMHGAVCSIKVNGTPIFNTQATTPATHDLCPEDSAQDGPQLATIAKRFSALALLAHKLVLPNVRSRRKQT
jgi:hypothetical protein